jgi:hypothetical protein
MGKIIIFFIGFALTTIGGNLGCKAGELTIIIEKPTELLSKADLKDASGNKVILILEKGVKGSVIKSEYSKDFMFYKIRTEDGHVGYVLYGDNLRILPGTSGDE